MNRQQVIEQRRHQGEENYRKKFEEFGLSERFKFIRRDWKSHKGRRVMIKCKLCSSVFFTWALDDIFKGKQSHLLCPHCGAASDGNDIWERSPRCDEAMAFYTQGHSVKETAERFGVSIAQINNSVKIRGLTNGRDWRDCQEHITQQKQDAESRLADRLDELGYDYLGGYMDKTERITIRCRTCGDVFERSVDFAKKGHLICRKCEHEKALIRQAEREEERAEELRQKEINRKQNQKRVEAENADTLFHLLNDKTHVCVVCGEFFSIADYMRDCGLKQIRHDPKYCSDACKRRANHRKSKECKRRSGNYDRGNHRHRARKYGVAYVSGITLKKVWKQNNGICQICGKPCDWSDRGWNKYCGPLYPSIDHVTAMANGGGHIWSNVQLAHMMCNSEKGDRDESIER